MNGLYYYKLVSPYPEDVTKNCKLTINEIDSNFLTLKDNDIKTAEFIRDEKTLVLTRNNDERLIVLLDDVTYNLDVKKSCNESGTTLTISYDGKDSVETVSIENVLTVDNLSKVIGSDILTKVITDGTLKGNGTMTSPLGIVGVEKTGSLAPVQEVFDLTDGEKLPEKAKLGTRYVTKEYVSDYGYLYNVNGIEKIQNKLDEEFISENTKESEKKYTWRVPSKQDWDTLLNSLEPKGEGCMCRNHDSSKCHVELGCVAGKMLKSECGWVGQTPCECSSRKPGSGCENYSDDIDDDQIVPAYDPESPSGIDNYGMAILPAGYGIINRYKKVEYSSFKEKAFFWTTTHVHGDTSQDYYVKVFDCDKSGVYQVAECPTPYYSVRLVKDYDGSNYRDSEYIDGILYKTILFPEAGQIWLASNYADTEGLIPYSTTGETADFLNPSDELIYDRRTEMFVNEWNGEYWEKRIMNDGETVVVQDPCYGSDDSGRTEIVWVDSEGHEHTVTVEIPKVAQTNIEYRVNVIDDHCNKDLVNTDNLVVERVLNIVIPILEEERWEREQADKALDEKIEAETARATSAETALDEKIDAETDRAISAETELWDGLAEEAMIREEADEILDEKIEAETSRAISAETELQEEIEAEVARATSAETVLDEKIDAEIERAISAETALDEKIDAETERAISAETALDEKIDEETERAIAREDEIEEELFEEIERAKAAEDEISGLTIDTSEEYTISVATVEEYNLILKSKDGIDSHFVKIKFDGNFGEI